MPEWLNEQTGVALMLGAALANVWYTWRSDTKEARQRELDLIADANARDQGYMSRMDENRQALRHVLQAQRATTKQLEKLQLLMSLESKHMRMIVDPSERPPPGGA